MYYDLSNLGTFCTTEGRNAVLEVVLNLSPSVTDLEEMLSRREISAYLGDSVLKVTAVQGCPQDGVLSPLLGSLIVDDLLMKLKHQGFEVIEYADDIVIIVRGKFDKTVSERMQTALNLTLAWCNNEGLSINP